MKHLILLIVITLFSYTAHAAKEQTSPAIVRTLGEGEIIAEPNQVDLTLAISLKDEQVSQLEEKSQEINTNLLKVMKDFSIERKNLETLSYNIQPIYTICEYNKECNPQIHAYQKYQSYKLTFNNLSKLSDLIDSLTKTGITNIDSINFSNSEHNKYYLQALELASLDAKNKAESSLSPLQKATLKVAEINVIDTSKTTPHVMARSASYMEKADTITNETIKIKANVEIKFAIETLK